MYAALKGKAAGAAGVEVVGVILAILSLNDGQRGNGAVGCIELIRFPPFSEEGDGAHHKPQGSIVSRLLCALNHLSLSLSFWLRKPGEA